MFISLIHILPKSSAFVDHGALSYVGCTDYLISCDESDDAFWSRLCIWDESVYAATLNYVASINQYVIDRRKYHLFGPIECGSELYRRNKHGSHNGSVSINIVQ